MSNVKMCDDCGAIFADGADGTSSGSMFNDSGRQIAMDFCDVHTAIRQGVRNRVWRPNTDTMVTITPTDKGDQ